MSSGDDLVVGLDIGGTNLRTGVIDRSQVLSNFTMRSSAATLTGPSAADALIGHVAEYLAATRVEPRAVAVGFPATVSADRRVVLSASNIPGMDGLPLADLIEDALGIPAFLNRDTNMLLLNDISALGLGQEKVIVGCYPGTGFGSALWIGGKLHVGKTGCEGELGHIPVRGLDLVCGCGNTGCIETIASGKYFEALVAERFPDTPIAEAFRRHADTAEVREFVDYLSLPIASAINILDPDAVIVGGGVVAMAGFPRDDLRSRVLAHTRKPEPAASLRLLFAEPKQENGVIGAGIYAFSELEKHQP